MTTQKPAPLSPRETRRRIGLAFAVMLIGAGGFILALAILKTFGGSP